METAYNLNRFLEAQESKYQTALAEIKNGQKESHWMFFIFPQIAGLGFTDFNIFYAIQNLEEATQYLNHPILGYRLIEISEELLNLQGKTALEILGKPDDRKLKSCMTLFSQIQNTNPIFKSVLEKYYQGLNDEKTIIKLQSQKVNN
jgi:uncharacterized protein (DUF1810 family)